MLFKLAAVCWLSMLPELLLAEDESRSPGKVLQGELTVIATHESGAYVPGVKVEIFSAESGERLGKAQSAKRKFRLPYGSYRVKVWAKDFRLEWQSIELRQEQLTVRTQLTIFQPCGACF